MPIADPNDLMDMLKSDPTAYEDERRADPEFNAVTPKGVRSGLSWAPQTIVTSTTNPERPRTLTAGYDSENFILTVQFRDHTLWNYYDVSPSMWDSFKSADSKNEFINSVLNGQPNGSATTSAKQAAAYKGMGARASKFQNETSIKGVSRQAPFKGIR
jgi:hypothetical protein